MHPDFAKLVGLTNGRRVQVGPTTSLPLIAVAGRSHAIAVTIMPMGVFDVVLGTDFLSEIGAVIDVKARTLCGSGHLPALTSSPFALAFPQLFTTREKIPVARPGFNLVLPPFWSPPRPLKPYRFAPAQEDASRKIVEGYLDIGIIRPSTAANPCPPFFAEIAKDRFCMDIRAANEALPDQLRKG